MKHRLDRVKSKFTWTKDKLERRWSFLFVSVFSFTFAGAIIFWNYQRMGLSHWDEYYFIGTAAWMLNRSWGFFQAAEPPLFPFILSVMFSTFGFEDNVAIATSGIMALSLCALTFWWTQREYNVPAAIVSVLILATTSLFLSYAKMALADMTFVLLFTVTIFVYVEALERRSDWIFLVAGFLLSLTLGVKYNGFLSLLIILMFTPFCQVAAIKRKASRRVHLGQVFGYLPKLWFSIIPVLVLGLLYVCFLANPQPPTNFPVADLFAVVTNLTPRLIQGLMYLQGVVISNVSSELRPQLLVSSEFYGNVLAEFVGLPILLLALVGAVSGILKRQKNTILLIIWVSVVFVFFSSLPGTWPRVLLPLMIPTAILASEGVLVCASAVSHFLLGQIGFRRNRKLNSLIKVGLVLLVVLVHFYGSIPVITNAHTAYRDAAEFLIANVPNRIVFYSCQPIILVYVNEFALGPAMTANAALLNVSSAVVLDFIAESQSNYAQVKARISQMTLATTIRNDVQINMLDSRTFADLRQDESNSDYMTIRIYVQDPPSSVSNFLVQPPAPSLFQVSELRKTGQSQARLSDF